MRAIIERIEVAGPDRRARRLVFSDPDIEPRTTSAAVVRALGLEDGAEEEYADLEEALSDAEANFARERALRVLGYRERSVHELTRRLRDDGYPDCVVDTVVERLQELALVDDERFAAQWVRARTAARFGPSRIRRELREKGIAEQIIEAVLPRDADDEVVERARSVLGSAPLETREQRDRAMGKLLRKGFDRQTALRALSASADQE